MNLNELIDYFKQFKGETSLQRIEREKQFIGKEIEVIGCISSIDTNTIWLGEIEPEGNYGRIVSQISYDGNKFTKQLLTFSNGDDVKIKAILRLANFDDEFHFTLISIEKLDTTRQSRKEAKEKAEKKSCFIATVCYESYDAPEVLILRRYRDEKLLRMLSGRIFVKLYYLVSPHLAALIAKSNLLKKGVKKYILEPIVAMIQQQNNNGKK